MQIVVKDLRQFISNFRVPVTTRPATCPSNFLAFYPVCPCAGWEWSQHVGQKMINKVASTIQVDLRLQCMLNCTLSPICDSYTTTVPVTRRVSSTRTTLRSSPTRPTSSPTAPGAGGVPTTFSSSKIVTNSLCVKNDTQDITAPVVFSLLYL